MEVFYLNNRDDRETLLILQDKKTFLVGERVLSTREELQVYIPFTHKGIQWAILPYVFTGNIWDWFMGAGGDYPVIPVSINLKHYKIFKTIGEYENALGLHNLSHPALSFALRYDLFEDAWQRFVVWAKKEYPKVKLDREKAVRNDSFQDPFGVLSIDDDSFFPTAMFLYHVQINTGNQNFIEPTAELLKKVINAFN